MAWCDGLTQCHMLSILEGGDGGWSLQCVCVQRKSVREHPNSITHWQTHQGLSGVALHLKQTDWQTNDHLQYHRENSGVRTQTPACVSRPSIRIISSNCCLGGVYRGISKGMINKLESPLQTKPHLGIQGPPVSSPATLQSCCALIPTWAPPDWLPAWVISLPAPVAAVCKRADCQVSVLNTHRHTYI